MEGLPTPANWKEIFPPSAGNGLCSAWLKAGKLKTAISIILACLFHAATVSAETGLVSEKVSTGVFVVTLTSDQSIEPVAAQRLIFPEAQKLCGHLPIGYGKFKFRHIEVPAGDAASPTIRFEFQQNVLCGIGKLGADANQVNG